MECLDPLSDRCTHQRGPAWPQPLPAGRSVNSDWRNACADLSTNTTASEYEFIFGNDFEELLFEPRTFATGQWLGGGGGVGRNPTWDECASQGSA